MTEYSRFVKTTANLLSQAELSEHRDQLSALALMIIENCAKKYSRTVDEITADVCAAI